MPGVFVSPRLTTLLALLLSAVLVMTQTLGVVHGMTHGQSGSALHLHDHDHHHADVPDEAGDASLHFFSALFSLHEEASDCRLYDQASHDGGLAAVMPLVLPFVPPPFAVAIFQGDALARWAALFDARGPPLTA
jgi:hypothetical protein